MRDVFPQFGAQWDEWNEFRRVKRKAREQDAEAAEAAALFNGGDAADAAASDSGDESADSVAEAGVEDALSKEADEALMRSASKRERQRLADSRTATMSTSEYQEFTRLRERARLGGADFIRWSNGLLRRSRLQLPGNAKETRFLGSLATTRVVQLVEAANRAAHNACLAPPERPLDRRHYQLAAAELEKEGRAKTYCEA